MKLFEFDISWTQEIVTSLVRETAPKATAQDESRHTGYRRVETDSVRIVAPDMELAERALRQAFHAANKLEIRTPPRELPINIWVSHDVKTLSPIKEVRRIGPDELNSYGKQMKNAGLSLTAEKEP